MLEDERHCFFTRFRNGDPRPLMRGWLHGVTTLIAIPLLAWRWKSLDRAVLPTALAIAWQLVASCLCHLPRWRTLRQEEYAYRCDRLGIILIALTSGSASQLIDGHCRPPLVFTLLTVIIPNLIGGAYVLAGNRSLGPFAGVGIACVATTVHWCWGAKLDRKLSLLAVLTVSFYGTAFWRYLKNLGVHKRIWGYHEDFHLFLTPALFLHVASTAQFVSVCTGAL